MILRFVVVVEVWYATLWNIAPNSSKLYASAADDDESTSALAAQLLILITLNNKYITMYTLLFTTLFLCDTRRCDNFFCFEFTSNCVLDDDTYFRKDFKHDSIRDDENIIKTQCWYMLGGGGVMLRAKPFGEPFLCHTKNFLAGWETEIPFIFLTLIFSTFPLIFHSFHIFFNWTLHIIHVCTGERHRDSITFWSWIFFLSEMWARFTISFHFLCIKNRWNRVKKNGFQWNFFFCNFCPILRF